RACGSRRATRRCVFAPASPTCEGLYLRVSQRLSREYAPADHQRRQQMRHWKVAIVIIATCTFGMAQDKTADKKPMGKPAMAHDHEKAAASNAMTPAKPAPEMEPVLSTVGTWSAIVKNEPSPWNPKGSTDKGTMVMSKGPGGSSVIQDFRSNGPM